MNKSNKIESKNIQDILALTPLQEGMLFHYLQAPGEGSYFNQLNLELSGGINLQYFEQAWNFVLETNEVLRTVFRWEKLEKPTQLVLKRHTLHLRYEDLSNIRDDIEQKRQWETIKHQDRNNHFDLRQVPFRVILGKMAQNRYQMLISNHHILYDGWSTGIILKEFFQAYETLAMGNQPGIQRVKSRFKEFIRWHQEQDRLEQKKFWQNYLQGFDTPTRLPVKRSKADPGFPGKSNYRVHLSQAVKNKLEGFVKDKRITLAAVFYCAWGILLQKYCRSEDVVFGTIVSGRSAPIEDIENMVGLLINTIPLRARTGPGETLLDFLFKINRHLAAREAYENTPLVDIRRYRQGKQDSGNELFDSIIAIENYPLESYLTGVKSQLSIDSHWMKEKPHYDLTVVVSTFDDIAINFIYNNESLDKSSVVRLAHHFSRILKSIPGGLYLQVHELEMLSEEEKHQLLVEFNDTGRAVGYPGDKMIHQLFAEQVERTPNRIALKGLINPQPSEGTRGLAPLSVPINITYKELYQKINQLAQLLGEKGVKPDTIVGIMVERSIEMVIGILAILKAGGAYLPIDPDYPQERIDYMLKDSGAKILLTGQEIASLYSPRALYLSEGRHPDFPASPSSSLVYVIYTSGSTGRPKGVMVQNRSLVNLLQALDKRYPLTGDDTYLLKTSYLFDVSVAELFGWFLQGGGLAILEPGGEKDPAKILEVIEREKVTHINFVPSMFNVFAGTVHPGNVEKLSGLKFIFLAGEALLPGVVERFRGLTTGVVLENIYGPTEAAVYSSWYSLSGWSGGGSIPIGKPLTNVTLYILDKWGYLQPVGVPGELSIGGEGLARGYLNRPALTSERFINYKPNDIHASMQYHSRHPITLSPHSPIYKTGDLAQWLEDGNIEFLGRIDFQVKIRGFRIELGEIENQLVNCEGVKEAVVTVRTGATGENVLCAYVVPFFVGELQIKPIKYHLGQKLPNYMIPGYFMLLEQIPLTPSGKIDRKSLPQPGLISTTPYAAPGNEIETELVRIWADVLGMESEQIGIDDHFFELGGHSLKVAGLIGNIHKKLKIEVPFNQVFQVPTVRGLAAYLSDQKKSWHSEILPVEKKEYYQLLSAQKSLFFLQQREPRGVVYNMPGLVILAGRVDVKKLESVFVGLISRHESLRTSFHMVKDEPVQRVHEKTGMAHWSLVTARADKSEIKEISEHFVQPFDLSRAPLLRVGLIKLLHTSTALGAHPSREGKEDRYLLMVDMHHIISDGASINIFLRDLAALYQGEELPRPGIQYKDFLEWKDRGVERDKRKRQETYWLKEFAGELPVLQLPTDDFRPLFQSLSGGEFHFKISPGQTQSLKVLALKEGVTLFMLLFSLYTVLLAKLSGQDDIIVGVPAADRRHPDLRHIMGMLINTLVIRNFPVLENSFKQFLEQVKTRTLPAFNHQDYPYMELVEKVVKDRPAGGNPLFDVMFALEEDIITPEGIQVGGSGGEGFNIKPYPYENRATKFDLTLAALEMEDTLHFRFEYAAQLFKKDTISRFSNYFREIISTVLGNNNIKLADIEIITPGEKVRILEEFNKSTAAYPGDKTVHELFAAQVERTPDHTALLGPDHHARQRNHRPHRSYKSYISITYRELNQKSNQLAHLLIANGVKPDTIVGIMVEPSLETVIRILGILKAGAAYLPIDPDYPQERTNYILEDSKVGILVKNSNNISFLCRGNLHQALAPAMAVSTTTLTTALTSASQVRPTHLAYIIYTSGSTGWPKGVMVEHCSLLNLLYALQRRYPLTGDDTYLLKTSYLFDVSVTELFGWYWEGGRLAVPEPGGEKDPARILEVIQREKVTHINFVPSMFNVFAGALHPGNIRKLSRLKYIFLAGEALLPGVVERFRGLKTGVELENIYGPTETAVYSSWYSLSAWSGGGTIPIGKPLPNVILYIYDKWGYWQPLGVPGELFIGGEGVARGYLNRPGLTAEKFDHDLWDHQLKNYKLQITNKAVPFGQVLNAFGEATTHHSPIYRTGDLARWLVDGNIEFLGRLDFQVKIRGFRIELGEIETHLLNHPRVREAVVIAGEANENDKFLCAYIRMKEGEGVPGESAALRDYLSDIVPDYMIPSFFVQMEEIPLTPTGKVDRKALPAPGIEMGDDYVAPRDKIEKRLAVIWSEVLAVEKEKISINDNFFHLGGHSLRAVVLAGRIHRELGVNIPLSEIFKASTSHLRGMAAYIKESSQSMLAAQYRYIPIEPGEEKEYYLLSSAQGRLYILQQMDKQGIGYNIPSVWQVEGSLAVEKLERVFHELIRRHESLRTSFHLVNDKPVQRIKEEVEFEVKVERKKEEVEEIEGTRGLAPLPKASAAALISSFIRSFDLSRAPLFRVGLIKIEEEQYILMVDMHHIIADGTSISVLIRNFMALYQGEAPPAQKIRCKDFSAWQRHKKQKKKIQEQELYWVKQWADTEEIPALNLPTDYPRARFQGFEGRTISIELEEEKIRAIKILARQQSVTMFMLLFTLYTSFLSRLSGQEDIVVGTPVAGRRHADLENIIGIFINTLALRNFPRGQKPFDRLLAEVKTRSLKAFDNQDYPFEDLVERLPVERDTSRSPLFDTLFALQEMDTETLEIPGIKLVPFEYDTPTAKFDLTLTAVQAGEKLSLLFTYRTTLFEEATIKRFIHCFMNILAAVQADKRIKLAEIEIIPAEEKRKILYDFNDTAAPYPREKTLHRLFAEQVEQAPDNTALHGCMIAWMHGEYGSITYKELNEKSNQLAHRLKEKGVRTATIVGIMAGRSIEIIVGILAILKAGGAYLPIDPEYPEERINYMLKDSGAEILLKDNDFTLEAFNIRPGGAIAHLHLSPAPVTSLAYIIYTSGSTGRPKGVMVEHKNVIRLVKNSNFIDYQQGQRLLMTGSPIFDITTFEIWAPLLNGLSLYQEEKDVVLEMEKLKEAVVKNSISILHLIPQVFYQVMDHCPGLFSGLEYFLVGGDWVRPGPVNRLRDRYKNLKIIHAYGPTENTTFSTTFRVEKHYRERIPIGKPVSNTSVIILNKHGQIQPPGVTGELCTGGEGAARGYLNNPELTAEKFVRAVISHSSLVIGSSSKTDDCSSKLPTNDQCPMTNDRLYRTGDQARWLEDGNIELLGRMDFQVKIRGIRIETGEIETHLLTHPRVREAVVIAREAKVGDRYLCAYIKVKADEVGTMEPEVLRDYIAGHVPDYMIPAYFVQMDKIPLTTTGKIDRKALPVPGIEVGDNYAAPRDEIEMRLAGIWADVLGVEKEKISIDDNFFHIGGHSLKAAVLETRIHREINVNIPMSEIFKTPRLRGMAAYIKQAVQSARDQHIPVQPTEEQEYYPLTSAQQRLYILQQMEKQGIGYNMPSVWRVEGKIEEKKLAGVFQKLIRRHESLRTSFHLVKDKPVQRIQDQVHLEIEYYNLQVTGTGERRGWEEAPPEQNSNAIGGRDNERTRGLVPLFTGPAIRNPQPAAVIITSFIRYFDLSRAPLFRMGLIKIEEEQYILMVDMHHIIADGVSMSLLVGDFMSFYGEKALNPLRIQYKDFAGWQRSERAKTIIRRQAVYWQKQFQAELPVTDLPTDFVRPLVQSFEGSSLNFEISGEEAEGLRRLVREKGATLYMVLLSVFYVFLSKITNQETIVVGTAVAGRRQADLEPIIGMFVNTLALINSPQSHKSFNDFLREVKENSLAAFENRDYPFEELVNTIRIEKNASRNPVFDVMFVLQSLNLNEIEIPGLMLKPRDYKTNISKFDLMLQVVEGNENLLFNMEYSTKLFKAATIHRFIHYFKAVATVAARSPGVKLSEIGIIPGKERELLLFRFNNTAAAYPKDRCLHELFQQDVRKHPDTVAVVYEGQYLSYGELDHHAGMLAGYLQAKGAGAEMRVGVMLDASLQMIVAVLAVVKAGDAYLPIDPGYPEDRIEYMLADSGAKLVVGNAASGRLLQTGSVEEVINVDENLFKQGTAAVQCPVHMANLLAYIIYTSGSTGSPKGVMVDHFNITRLVKNTNYIQFNAGDRLLQTGALEFDASTFEIWGSLLNGLTLYLAPREKLLNAGILKSIIARGRINVIWMTAPLFNQMVDTDENIFQGIGNLLVGGDVLSPSHIGAIRGKFPRLNIINGYGPTENTTFSTTFLIEKEYKTAIPIGRPIANSTAYVVDKNGKLQPVGVWGELWVGGDGVSRGYLNNPELTSERFGRAVISHLSLVISPSKKPYKYTNDRFYKTGDLVRWLADGNIEFLGRLDFQVKIRGFRIELGEIETHLLKHPGVNDAVVVSGQTREKDKYICAYIRPGEEEPGPIEPAVLRDYLSNRLPGYMIPSYFVQLEKIPLTTSGKVDRKALPVPELEVGDNYAAPRDEMEMRMVKVWSEILGIEKDRISIGSDFFHLGGHSLKATILTSRIHKEWGVKVSLAEIFKRRTIQEQVKYIRHSEIKKYAAIKSIEKKEYYELTSAQKRLYFLQGMDRQSTGYNMPLVFPPGKDIEKNKLETTLKKLIDRHESLRTSFQLVNETPIQKIHQAVNFTVEYYDLQVTGSGDRCRLEEVPFGQISNAIAGRYPKSQELRAKSFISSFIRAFDLSRAPLIRSGLIRLPDSNYIWLLDIHHLVSDGTSLMVLTEDFHSMYNDRELEPLKLQYKDFAQWQNRESAGDGMKAQQAYWLGVYADAPGIPRLNLVGDYKRPEVFTFKGDHVNFSLEGEEAARFRSIGFKNDATLYMNVLGVLNVLLYRYSGQTDIIIGSGIAGRLHDDLQHIVGMFVNTLAIRSRPGPGKTYQAFLNEVVDASLKAFENQDVQFEDLVDKLELERDPSRNPLFDVSMVVQNFRKVQTGEPGERNLKNLPVSIYQNPTAKFDLAVFVSETGPDIEVNIEYYTGIYKAETIHRLITHLKNVIQAVSRHPSIQLKDIDMLTGEEKKQVLDEFNATAMDYPSEKTIPQLFREQVKKTPDHIAVVGLEHENGQQDTETPVHITYGEIDKKSNQVARYLYEAKGIEPEDRIGIWMSRSVYLPVSILGTLKAGAAYVPIDPTFPGDRIKFMLNEATIGIVISEKRYIRDLNRMQWECECFHSYLCPDSAEVYQEEEVEQNGLMNRELWHHVGETSVDEITGGGWVSSYTGESMTRQEMDEYGDNILCKLQPLLHQGMRVLEIGCATGISMYRIAPRVRFYYGTDLSQVIIEKNKKRVKQEGHKNIKLSCLAAHEIDKIKEEENEGNFHLVIMNSVIQCFHGHNYLRQVVKKAINLLAPRGWLFVGDIMDQDKKDEMIRELIDFKYTHRTKSYTTKTEFSSELFISRNFWRDLEAEWAEIDTVKCTDKRFTIENELTRFRYDALLSINKNNLLSPAARENKKHKYQDGLDSYTGLSAEPLTRGFPSNRPAYIIYTSGSTGRPKGVAVEHTQLVNFVYHMYNNYNREVDGNDRCLGLTNITFDVSVWEFFLPLLYGARLVILPKQKIFDVIAMAETILREGITLIYIPPGLLKPVNEQLKKQGVRVRLNKMLVGVEPIRDEVLEAYMQLNPHMQIINGYGPTETTICATSLNYTSHQPKGEIVPIGVPLANNQVVLLDAEDNIVPVGIPGEICISGDGVTRGYLNNPRLTAEKYTRHPYFKRKCMYRSGDLARWLPQGNILFIGRRDQQVKVRGYQIEMGEIRNEILKLKEIKEAVVTVKEGSGGDKYLTAYIVSEKGLEELNLKEYLAGKLPGYMIPSYFIGIERVPCTRSGKVDEKALPGPKVTTAEQDTVYRNEIEEKLADLWGEVLDRQQGSISVNANFFEIGGHSLKAMILVAKIHKLFNVKLPLAQLFKNPTLREQAKYLEPSVQTIPIHGSGYLPLESAEKKEYYPLSPAQKRLYILQQFTSGDISYNMPYLLPLEPQKDGKNLKKGLERVFSTLIARHESLRTSFQTIDDKPVQRIHRVVDFEIKYHKQEGWTSEEEIKTHLLRPFDLSRAPLLRVELVKTGEGTFVLFIDMHHIITDGTSQNILRKEFMTLYQDPGKKLPGLRFQYKDYSQWVNSARQQELKKQQATYWLKQFPPGEESPVLNLPTDYPRPLVQGFEGNWVNFALNSRETDILKTIAGENDVTLFMCLLAVFNVLFSKLSGQEDIILGTPIAARRHVDLQQVIGMLVNTLPMRNYPGADKPWQHFLQEVKKRTLEAYENQEYPFEELVDHIAVTRDTSRNPVFDVMLNLLNQSEYTDDTPVINERHLLKHRKGTSKFDLNITALDPGKELFFNIEYSTNLYKPGTIDRIIGYFRQIVAELSNDTTINLSNINMVPKAEKEEILAIATGKDDTIDTNDTIHLLFENQAAGTPHQTSIVETNHHRYYSYQALNRKANRLARFLSKKGVRRETIVGIMVTRSIEMIVGILAVMKAGGAYLPIDPGYPVKRKTYMVEDSGITLLLTNEHKKNIPALPGGIEILDPGNEAVYSPDDTNPGHHVNGTNLIYVIYTSGSTGKPKGVMLEHKNLVNLIQFQYKYTNIDSSGILQFASISFDASFHEIFSALLAGGRLYLIQEQTRTNIPELSAIIAANKIKTLFLPISFLKMIFKEEDYIPLIPGCIEHIQSAGDQVLIENNFRKYLRENKVVLHNHYGPSETHVVTTLTLDYREELPERPTIGKPIMNTSIYILDKKNQLLPIGVPGELFIGGMQVGRGYLGKVHLTAEKFILSPFKPGERLYRTGDLSRWQRDGKIEFLGRIDSQVKIRGFRVELGEIESHLLNHPGIKEAVVAAKTDKNREKYLCAYIVPDKELPTTGVREYLAKDLPGYMIPSHIVFLEKIPLTPSHKLDRRALPEPEGKAGPAYCPPRNPLEKKLEEIWAEVLDTQKIGTIGIDDNFFELGGHSLKATVMMSKLHKEFNIKVDLVEIFKTPTIRGIASLIQTIQLAANQEVGIGEEIVEMIL